MEQIKLSGLLPGESGVVLGLSKSQLTPKLTEMGLMKGKKIRVLFQAPFNGPLAIDVEGYVLSLRTEEANIVAIEKAITAA